MPALTLEAINRADADGFTAVLGDVFESSPWFARRAHRHGPFTSTAALIRAMTRVLDEAADEEKLAFIRAHPDLAGKAARARDLEPDSTREQASAGLDRLSDADFTLFMDLNRRYREKFGFPFIIAVRDHTLDSIIEAFHRRLESDPQTEMAEALANIARIVSLRIRERIGK
ncbi:MAG: 2-oxo-4-hydroxy-4-carboxy-5-ureidoimidazoline decarboxylase [bacterium]|nr:2-oxo-4-hydroxy-4-carboxy-5-ureidoimidazoline decarboxylase [bacterium]MDE0242399.1 2-oxo-4-hydroxy-4-carboxy-5-ureidoimidazoline decarboxylase [bacterium]MDE0418622.1 2-oxo-4-hydroxy-4-carboxy-5-ureidoimidazoline decarboxylase [bacterium]